MFDQTENLWERKSIATDYNKSVDFEKFKTLEYYGWGGGHSNTTFDEYNYTVGTLVIATYDAKKKELIWKAIGQKTVDEDPKNRERNVGRTVAKIMKDYPVKPLK